MLLSPLLGVHLCSSVGSGSRFADLACMSWLESIFPVYWKGQPLCHPSVGDMCPCTSIQAEEM